MIITNITPFDDSFRWTGIKSFKCGTIDVNVLNDCSDDEDIFFDLYFGVRGRWKFSKQEVILHGKKRFNGKINGQVVNIDVTLGKKS